MFSREGICATSAGTVTTTTTFATDIGTEYLLTFDMAGNPEGGQAIKDLRAKTTVTYMGDFQPGSAGAAAGTPATGAISTTEAAAPAAPAPAPTPAAAAAPPPVAPADVNPAVDDKTRAVIEKGIKGLK